MENKHEQTWKLLVETARAKHRHTIIMETASQEELKRKNVWSRCSLCKGCVSVWFESDDSKYCQACHKIRFDKCEACCGCLDWGTLVRKDDFCSECFYEMNGSY